MTMRGALMRVMSRAGWIRACDFMRSVSMLTTTCWGVSWPRTESLQMARAATAAVLSMENLIVAESGGWLGQGR